jgi:DNA-binding NarL/FixJ family response regulator
MDARMALPAQAPAPVRVLAVDDQAAFRDAALEMVERTPGFELAGASADGESAVRLARELDPDLVLLDIRMDGMDGIETARRITAESPGRVVVLVSSADVRELADLAGRSGATAILRKHWLSPRLLRGLWVALRRR